MLREHSLHGQKAGLSALWSLVQTTANDGSPPIWIKKPCLLAQKPGADERASAFLIRLSGHAAVQEGSWPISRDLGGDGEHAFVICNTWAA
jgi:hypothetical protein